ncbi:MAG: hypothetical protein D6687_06325 [Acidobacteria bacterium]|jgi:hypothetical protein|nr:MAG: hypothetical protein D6687_06325 [Acidobacteriota bacterium]GIU82592.1 MAG: hypothetical protein KatS3mg006_1656 [Pyrinomonadaceae bacterium]
MLNDGYIIKQMIRKMAAERGLSKIEIDMLLAIAEVEQTLIQIRKIHEALLLVYFNTSKRHGKTQES